MCGEPGSLPGFVEMGSPKNICTFQAQIYQCAHPMDANNQSERKHGGKAGGFERTEVTHNIARLTVRLLLHSVEGLATQLGAAGHADKAVHMEDLVHGSAAGAFTHHVLSTAGTAPWGEEEEEAEPIFTLNRQIFKVR